MLKQKSSPGWLLMGCVAGALARVLLRPSQPALAGAALAGAGKVRTPARRDRSISMIKGVGIIFVTAVHVHLGRPEDESGSFFYRHLVDRAVPWLVVMMGVTASRSLGTQQLLQTLLALQRAAPTTKAPGQEGSAAH